MTKIKYRYNIDDSAKNVNVHFEKKINALQVIITNWNEPILNL